MDCPQARKILACGQFINIMITRLPGNLPRKNVRENYLDIIELIYTAADVEGVEMHFHTLDYLDNRLMAID